MSISALNEGSAVLRLDFNVVEAVQHRGLFAVLLVALAAWWNRPQMPDDPRLRADMGLPPLPRSAFWPEPSGDDLPLPPPFWRVGS